MSLILSLGNLSLSFYSFVPAAGLLWQNKCFLIKEHIRMIEISEGSGTRMTSLYLYVKSRTRMIPLTNE